MSALPPSSAPGRLPDAAHPPAPWLRAACGAGGLFRETTGLALWKPSGRMPIVVTAGRDRHPIQLPARARLRRRESEHAETAYRSDSLKWRMRSQDNGGRLKAYPWKLNIQGGIDTAAAHAVPVRRLVVNWTMAGLAPGPQPSLITQRRPGGRGHGCAPWLPHGRRAAWDLPRKPLRQARGRDGGSLPDPLPPSFPSLPDQLAGGRAPLRSPVSFR